MKVGHLAIHTFVLLMGAGSVVMRRSNLTVQRRMRKVAPSASTEMNWAKPIPKSISQTQHEFTYLRFDQLILNSPSF